MAKYASLRNQLSLNDQPRLTLTFDQIAALVGPLPRSAWDHRVWWANHGATHTHAEARLAAGDRVESVSRSRGSVAFVRSSRPDSVSSSHAEVAETDSESTLHSDRLQHDLGARRLAVEGG